MAPLNITRTTFSTIRSPVHRSTPPNTRAAFKSTLSKKKNPEGSHTPDFVQSELIPLPPNVVCWVDASMKRRLIAVIIDNKYKVFPIKPQWKAGSSIHRAEAVGVELVPQILSSMKFTGHAILHSDSELALRAFNGLKVRGDPFIDDLTNRLKADRTKWGFSVEPKWVSNKKNLADPLSRGKPAIRGLEPLECSIELSEPLESLVHKD